jgi:hypothetical protein
MGRVTWDRYRGVDWSRRVVSTREQEFVLAGKSGSGKTTQVRNEINACADAGQESLWVYDFHGSLIDAVLGDLLPRHEARIELLDLAYTKKMWGADLMPYPDANWIGDLRRDEGLVLEQFLQMLCRERQIKPATMPYVNTYGRMALGLRLKQRPRVSLRLVPYALNCCHPNQLAMIEHCTNKDLAWALKGINLIKNVYQREGLIGPAQRIIQDFFRNEAADGFLSVPPVDVYEWNRQKKIVLVKSNLQVAESASRVIIGSLFLQNFYLAARHQARFGTPLPIKQVCDEFLRLRPGELEADLLDQGRKWGVACTMLVQRIPPEFRPILNSVSRLEIFALGPLEAEEAADCLMGFLYDKKKVKDIERRERTMQRGVKREQITTTSKRKDKDGHKLGEQESTHFLSTPEMETVIDEQKIWEQVGEQKQDWITKICRLGTEKNSERYVIDGARATERPVKVIKRETTWSKERIQQAVERIRSSYATPDFTPPQLVQTPIVVESASTTPPNSRGSRLTGRRSRRQS